MNIFLSNKYYNCHCGIRLSRSIYHYDNLVSESVSFQFHFISPTSISHHPMSFYDSDLRFAASYYIDCINIDIMTGYIKLCTVLQHVIHVKLPFRNMASDLTKVPTDITT